MAICTRYITAKSITIVGLEIGVATSVHARLYAHPRIAAGRNHPQGRWRVILGVPFRSVYLPVGKRWFVDILTRLSSGGATAAQFIPVSVSASKAVMTHACACLN